MGISNQNILLVLFIILIVIVALLFVVLTHKYEGGNYSGGARHKHKIDDDDDVDIGGMVNKCSVCGGVDCKCSDATSSVNIDDMVGDSSSVSSKSTVEGSGMTKLTFNPDLFEDIVKGKKTYDVRRKFGRFETLKSGDVVQLNRTKPEDESKYGETRRVKAEILKVETYDTFEKAASEKFKDTYPSYKDVKEAKKEFEKYDKNPDAKFVLIHFKVKDVKKGGVRYEEFNDCDDI